MWVKDEGLWVSVLPGVERCAPCVELVEQLCVGCPDSCLALLVRAAGSVRRWLVRACIGRDWGKGPVWQV